MANDYDDSDLEENKKSATANKKDAEKIMKKGEIAPNPDKPKMKMRCGATRKGGRCGHTSEFKHGGRVVGIAKRGFGRALKKRK